MYLFLFWELRGLSPHFHIHVSVSDLYPRISPHISCSRIYRHIDKWEYINRSQTHECGNWVYGVAIPFLGIFVSNFRYLVLYFFVHVFDTLCTACSYGDGCSSRNNLYTDVSPYIEWIESVVGKDTVCQASSHEPEQTTVYW